jgi:regulator of replication initiation timing
MSTGDTLKSSFAALQQQLAKMDASIVQLSTDIAKVNKVVSTIEEKVNVLAVDTSAIRGDLANTNKVVASLQTKQKRMIVEMASQASAINRLEQLGMAPEIAIHNLPAAVDHGQFYTAMMKWTDSLLTEDKVKRCNLVLDKNKAFKSAYITFWSERDKVKFKSFVGKKKTDANKKYAPILASQIFDIDISDPQRTAALEIKDPMTKLNRTIFNLLREKTSRKNANVYIANGLVNVRFGRENAPITVHSKEEVDNVLRKHASQ